MASDKAHKVVEVVLTELTGRKGLDDTWDSIDEEIQEEIIGICAKLVDKELNSFRKEIKELKKDSLAWCVMHGARVQFYHDGAVNLSYYPIEGNDDLEVEAYGDTLEEAIKEAKAKAKEAESEADL